MATNLTFNGSPYQVPAYADTGWAAGSGNLSSYLIAIASGTLQTTGGTFTLSAEVNFGATYGAVLAYVKSASANPSSAGYLRMANADLIEWRNHANSGNDTLGVNSSDQLVFNGSPVAGSSIVSSSFSGQTSVTITHNLGHYPIVQILDGSGNLIDPNSLNHGSVNAFTVTFNPMLSGTILYVG
jgi:hypothetical protein